MDSRPTPCWMSWPESGYGLRGTSGPTSCASGAADALIPGRPPGSLLPVSLRLKLAGRVMKEIEKWLGKPVLNRRFWRMNKWDIITLAVIAHLRLHFQAKHDPDPDRGSSLLWQTAAAATVAGHNPRPVEEGPLQMRRCKLLKEQKSTKLKCEIFSTTKVTYYLKD